ncbi:GGDEF domain-containing protein, partial [Jeotgalibaca porci]|uniref:GGDEF domain-containing protein n=2 Tax=Jeotgalibaca porci TaxID=1868793 RepID=UPI0035A18244
DLLQIANTELKRRAMLDDLTEVMNRLGFDSSYGEIWKKSVRDRTSLALVMVDIDHFKCLNDTYGHLFGDEWIKRV